MEEHEEVRRAVRTAIRSIQSVEADLPKDTPSQQIAAAIQQLAFAVEKLVNLMAQSKPLG
jgi:hypothetical protein